MNILFLDTVHPILEERLSEAGHRCVHDTTCTYDDFLEKIAEFDGLVIRSRLPIDEAVFAVAHRLKFIARSGSGLENIDVKSAERHHVQIFSSPEGNRDAVGEHAMGMLLMLLNRLHLADREVRQGLWHREANRGYELAGRTVGIISYGHMGSAFAQRLSGFGCRILAYDKYRSLHPAGQTEQVELSTLQRESDVISLHVPLSDETRYYIDDAFIAACAKPFILINTSRGNQVDTAALTRGLRSGAVSGACLDVLEYEKRSLEGLAGGAVPEPLKYLIESDRVVLTPHVAGWTHESYVKLSSVLADKILAEF